MLKILKQYLCKHYWNMISGYYMNGKNLYIWKCSACGKIKQEEYI